MIVRLILNTIDVVAILITRHYLADDNDEIRISTENLNDQLPLCSTVQSITDTPGYYFFFTKKSIKVIQASF